MSEAEGGGEEEEGGPGEGAARALWDAARYLCKLGANLHKRCAARRRRVARAPPGNAHAVHKEVDKILTICALSRKSLDNVECVVGKVRAECEERQRGQPRPRPRPHRLEMRRVGKHILKVPVRVSLDHYRSCRVRLSSSITAEEFDRYPIYFDCEALRSRQRHSDASRWTDNGGDSSPKLNEKQNDKIYHGDCEGENNIRGDKSESDNDDLRHVATKKKESEIKQQITVSSSEDENGINKYERKKQYKIRRKDKNEDSTSNKHNNESFHSTKTKLTDKDDRAEIALLDCDIYSSKRTLNSSEEENKHKSKKYKSKSTLSSDDEDSSKNSEDNGTVKNKSRDKDVAINNKRKSVFLSSDSEDNVDPKGKNTKQDLSTEIDDSLSNSSKTKSELLTSKVIEPIEKSKSKYGNEEEKGQTMSADHKNESKLLDFNTVESSGNSASKSKKLSRIGEEEQSMNENGKSKSNLSARDEDSNKVSQDKRQKRSTSKEINKKNKNDNSKIENEECVSKFNDGLDKEYVCNSTKALDSHNAQNHEESRTGEKNTHEIEQSKTEHKNKSKLSSVDDGESDDCPDASEKRSTSKEKSDNNKSKSKHDACSSKVLLSDNEQHTEELIITKKTHEKDNDQRGKRISYKSKSKSKVLSSDVEDFNENFSSEENNTLEKEQSQTENGKSTSKLLSSEKEKYVHDNKKSESKNQGGDDNNEESDSKRNEKPSKHDDLDLNKRLKEQTSKKAIISEEPDVDEVSTEKSKEKKPDSIGNIEKTVMKQNQAKKKIENETVDKPNLKIVDPSETDMTCEDSQSQDITERSKRLKENENEMVDKMTLKIVEPSVTNTICEDSLSQDIAETSKPLIKCVDLSRLLKSPSKSQSVEHSLESSSSMMKLPDLLVESHSVARACEESKYAKKMKRKEKQEEKKKTAKQNIVINLDSSDDESTPIMEMKSKTKRRESKLSSKKKIKSSHDLTVKQARELVAAFKPKKFDIKVDKIPTFSNSFLKSHGLKIITQSGSIIAQLSEDSVVRSAKTDLLTDSSDSDSSKGMKKKASTEAKSPKAKRRRLIETARAKRLLLSGSSSKSTSESEDLVNEALKEIKNVVKAFNSDDAEKNAELEKTKLLESSTSSLSEEDLIEKVVNSMSKLDSVVRDATLLKVVDNKSENENSRSNKNGSKTSSISQVDGNDDAFSGSDNEMGRTTRSQASSSDSKDDRAVESLTNLKSLHRKQRERDSPSTSKHGNNSKNSDKVKDGNTEEDMIELDSKSSSEVEDAASEGSAEMPVEDQNGQVIGEHARDELLNDSDSDSAHQASNRESDDAGSKSNGKAKTKKELKEQSVVELGSSDNESEEEDEDLKVRRRKANAISSDSEAGGSNKKKKKKKQEDDSDYKHSGGSDSDSDVGRKTKRRAERSSGSEGSRSRSSDGGKGKKRKRIKQVNESDGSDGSGSDNEGKKSGRKNIRKVMGKDQLEEATKKAAREERERLARITERQKLYNNTAFDESGKPDEVILDKVVLDYDPETKEPLIEVDKGIVKKLKPHQANGIKFMWDACFESVKQIKKGKGSGCILAHCMGLGKTLQVVSLCHTLLTHAKLTKVRRVLVVCPLSTVLNWVNEFNMWMEFAESDQEIQIYELSRYKQNNERMYQLQDWLENGGVCVLGYEMFRNLSADNPKKFRKKMLKTFQESLVNPGPDLVVCDEGHLLKNEKTSLSQSMNRVKTLRRIVLTGTPLQNNLKEYYCMVQFVKPNLLGKYNEYLNRFVNPITNGQYTDSTEYDIRIMKRRSHVLHKMLDGSVQRRDYGVLAPFLPPKHEYVLFITLTDIQIKLYQHYLDNHSRRQQAGKTTGFLFQDFQSLQRIWTHPLVLKANSERYEIAQQKKRDREEEEDSEGSLADFLDDDSTAEETSTDEDSDDMSDVSDGSRKKSKKKSPKKNKKNEAGSSRRNTRANPGEKIEEIDLSALKDPDDIRSENPTEWWMKLVDEKELEDMRNSNKLMLLFDILRQCEAIGDKLLVFSQSLYSLDLIEQFLSRIDEATQLGKVEEELGGYVGSWSPGLDYFRLDGSTSCENRSIWCKNFNKEDNPRARLFLISTRAGGLGINLVAANRVVIFDVSWNPSHDVQSIFRVYRFGQKKPCYVYRFLAMGTMEEKIYERQVTKQAISKRVIDEQQIDRHYAENDLAELYVFQPVPEQPRPVPLLPKDRLFAEMLKDREKLIYRYHEHDSLLENKTEETLTEEERKAAWEDFENEKNRPPPTPFTNVGFMPQMNGMGNMLAQQQIALATMLNVIRKDYPGLSEQQIANILPQILYGGDTMMQKMRAMGAGGMNSNLMMNPGVAGLGGSSALGFQPTWQQQQQMQLQRIQQQQAMASSGPGVKYYAGGLGSRDPLSMALQQKQQREMMLNTTGDRLRDMLVGSTAHADHFRQRPLVPGQPAPPPRPPTHTGEVVDLDDSE